jgi:hypothetical protein
MPAPKTRIKNFTITWRAAQKRAPIMVTRRRVFISVEKCLDKRPRSPALRGQRNAGYHYTLAF